MFLLRLAFLEALPRLRFDKKLFSETKSWEKFDAFMHLIGDFLLIFYVSFKVIILYFLALCSLFSSISLEKHLLLLLIIAFGSEVLGLIALIGEKTHTWLDAKFKSKN